MRLIDADAYADDIWKMRRNYQLMDDTQTADKIMHGLYRAEQALKDAPTIDAVPVVRCKECKWFGGKYNDYCFRDEYNHAGDWYCADGERREG